MNKRKKTAGFVFGGLTILVLLAFAFPFFWMLLASFKTQAQIMATDQLLFFTPTADNYASVFKEYDFLK